MSVVLNIGTYDGILDVSFFYLNTRDVLLSLPLLLHYGQ